MSKKMSHRKADLGDQYHEIGITAVAAAVRYQGDSPGTRLQHPVLERSVGAEYE